MTRSAVFGRFTSVVMFSSYSRRAPGSTHGRPRSGLDGGDDPAFGIDVKGPASHNRQPHVRRWGQDADGGRRHDLMGGHAVDLRIAADGDLDGIARGQVVKVAEDISLDVIVAVENRVAGPKRGGKRVACHR